METALTTSLADLRARLPELPQRDQLRLGRRADRAAALRDTEARERAFGEISTELDRAAARVAARRQSVPVISYPPELPISQKKDEIKAAIREHQVVIVAGETGSGKTTQLPKICLELGRGVTGQIGHTQPRRIAARTVAARIAEELDTELGSTVGYQVRFSDNSSDQTLVKLMTDGILLTELQRDRRLLRYDTLIIDEAHERSLNVDFILGYLKRLLPSRPDLKVIITSATIDPHRFSEHFAEGEGRPRTAPKAKAPKTKSHSRTYGEALITGPANRALGPVSGRCLGEVPPRGAERSGGFRGVAPRVSTANRALGPVSGRCYRREPQRVTVRRPLPAQRTGPLGPVSGRCLGEVPPRGAERIRGVPGGRPPGLALCR